MSQNPTTTENDENVLDGKARAAAYQAKRKKSKRNARLIFAATVAVAAAIAVKYVHTPVPEWADDSEDV